MSINVSEFNSQYNYWIERFFENHNPDPLIIYFWNAFVGALSVRLIYTYRNWHETSIESCFKNINAVASVITQSGLGLGERIYQSIIAIENEVWHGNHYRVVLLCAPIVCAVEQHKSNELQTGIIEVIEQAQKSDTELIYQALRLTAPASPLTEQWREAIESKTDLYAIMNAASARDVIARQYACAFMDIFSSDVVEMYSNHIHKFGVKNWVAEIFHAFSSKFKNGRSAWLEKERMTWADGGIDNSQSGARKSKLTAPNQTIEEESRNKIEMDYKDLIHIPDMSADLTVAALFAHGIQNYAKYA